MIPWQKTHRHEPGVHMLIAGGLGLAMLAQRGGHAAAGEVEISKVPAKIRDAALKVVAKAKWSAAEQEQDDDHDAYELTGKDVAGRAVMVHVTAEGKVTECRTEVPLNKVPKEVWRSVAKKFPMFEAMTAYQLRTDDDLRSGDDGELNYEVSGLHAQDLIAILVVTPDGTISELEQQIAVADIPDTVLAAVKGKMPKFKVTTAYVISEDGDVVGHQLTGKRGKNKKSDEIEVFVSAGGQEIEFDE